MEKSHQIHTYLNVLHIHIYLVLYVNFTEKCIDFGFIFITRF